MENIIVELRNEQEKRVLLAFLNAVNYDFTLQPSEHSTDIAESCKSDHVVSTDESSSLGHYATE